MERLAQVASEKIKEEERESLRRAKIEAEDER